MGKCTKLICTTIRCTSLINFDSITPSEDTIWRCPVCLVNLDSIYLINMDPVCLVYLDSITLSEEDTIGRCEVETSVGAAVPTADVCIRAQPDTLKIRKPGTREYNVTWYTQVHGGNTCLVGRVFDNGASDRACSRKGFVAPP